MHSHPFRRGALVALAVLALPAAGHAQGPDTLTLPGLRRPVEILRDRHGIAHIYAANEEDLFFAQGFSAARDRLFQLEIWRRQATGTVAELLGPREVARDAGTRLFRFRGDMAKELAHYHPRGARIVGAFVRGINAWVALAERDSTLVPLELRLLGAKPGRWTPDVVISRHQGLLGNAEEELRYGRAVAALGADVVRQIAWFEPHQPDLTLHAPVDSAALAEPILDRYRAFRAPLRFESSDLADTLPDAGARDAGSNNWVVSGRLSASGAPMMANDPHRAQSVPSLRSWVHLVAPGWNVVGGGEPAIPGVSIGHNEHGAWGLTIFGTDAEDLLVYRTDRADHRRYRYRGRWERMRELRERIAVKGRPDTTVELRYTRHGPVVYEDTVRHLAWVVRAAWLEPGSAPYLASLRMNQARTWEEFRAACAYSYIPAENMVWADRAGNIGWQAVGIAPVRRGWSGMVPVPGDGRFEWGGYLPVLDRPNAFNPASGWIATANNELAGRAYGHPEALGHLWADPYRWQRIAEVLGAGRKLTVEDMARLQTDYLSLPARELVPLLAPLAAADVRVEEARRSLLAWDRVLAPASVAAGIYQAWYRRLEANAARTHMTERARAHFPSVSTRRVVGWLTGPAPTATGDARATRDSLVLVSLAQAVDDLVRRFGPDSARWVYGQEGYKHALIRHPMSAAVAPRLRARLDVGPAPRGGDGNTVGATGSSDNQTTGASFRIVADAADWERTLGTNTPGQSGDPDSPHYRDLFPLWAEDRFFPVPFARAAVEAMTQGRTVLLPTAARR